MLSRHPFAVPVITFAVLLAAVGGYFVLRQNTARPTAYGDAKIVIISHDRVKQVVPSRQQTVAQLIKKLQIPINEGDIVEPSPNTMIDQDQFRINIYRALPVEIVDGGHKIFTYSAATTPRSIAAQTGLTVYPEDVVTTDPVQNFVTTGSIGKQVIVNRATAVNLNLYGTPVNVRTHAKTVGLLIKSKGIKLAKSDQLMPAADTPLTPNIQVFVVRNGTKIETVTEPVAMPVQRIEDRSLAYGTSAVRQAGAPGEQILTYQDDIQNGLVIKRTLIQTVVTKQPVTQIVVVGTSLSGIKGDMALAGIAPSDYNYVDYIVSRESGWCPTKAQGERYCPATPNNPMTPNGYGLCQATPGYKMASAGSDWQTSPITQLRWCSGYAQSRYGGWAGAYNFWVRNHYW